jgi:hypothetical protein
MEIRLNDNALHLTGFWGEVSSMAACSVSDEARHRGDRFDERHIKSVQRSKRAGEACG